MTTAGTNIKHACSFSLLVSLYIYIYIYCVYVYAHCARSVQAHEAWRKVDFSDRAITHMQPPLGNGKEEVSLTILYLFRLIFYD